MSLREVIATQLADRRLLGRSLNVALVNCWHDCSCSERRRRPEAHNPRLNVSRVKNTKLPGSQQRFHHNFHQGERRTKPWHHLAELQRVRP